MNIERTLEANGAAYEALRRGLKPGITEREVYELVRETVDGVCGSESHGFIGDFVGSVRTGFGGRMPHHVGHLVGPKPYLKPAFEEGDETMLPEGCFCTLEPGLYFAGTWGLRIENDYRVTSTGLENLFDYPRDLAYFTL